MTEFIITEDFPKNEAEFDKRFSTEDACFEYLHKMRAAAFAYCRNHTATQQKADNQLV